MDLIYTNADRIDQGVLHDYELDIDLAKDKDFEIKTDPSNAVMAAGSYWYIPGTEYGGRVDRIKVDTDSKELTYGGRSWRGMLASKLVEPRTLGGGWQDVVQTLLDDCGLSELFVADAAGLTLDAWPVGKYTTLLDVLSAVLDGKQHRLDLYWSGDRVHVGAAAIRDLTDTVQYETDDKVHLVVEDNRGGVNHLICIGTIKIVVEGAEDGAAEETIEEEVIVHLYTTATGAITEMQQTYTGLDEIMDIYEGGGTTTREELKSAGFDRLKELRNSRTFSVSVEDYDVQIGDIVGGKERITGISVAEKVTNIIYKIDSGGKASIEYKVGENA